MGQIECRDRVRHRHENQFRMEASTVFNHACRMAPILTLEAGCGQTGQTHIQVEALSNLRHTSTRHFTVAPSVIRARDNSGTETPVWPGTDVRETPLALFPYHLLGCLFQ